MLIVRTKKDALKVKDTDSFIIDVWPSAEEENQEITQEMIDLEAELFDLITNKSKDNNGNNGNNGKKRDQ